MDRKNRKELFDSINKKTDEIISKMPYFAKLYFTDLYQNNFSPKTRQQYAYDMLRFFNWLQEQSGFANSNIAVSSASDIFDKLTKEDIQSYKDSVMGTCDSLALSRKISCLRSFISYYYQENLIQNALHEHITMPKQENREIKNTLTPEQIVRIINVIEDTKGLSGKALGKHNKTYLRDKAIMYVLLGTGIRIQELVNIDVKEIDFEEKTISVQRKGNKADKVYINPEIEKALRDYLNNGREQLFKQTIRGEDKKFITSPEDESALFISLFHKRITARAVETLIKQYALKAGLNINVTPHTLRRTFGTNVYNVTSDIYLTASALGHSSVETTKKHYAKIDESHKKLAAKTSSRWLK